MVSFLSIPATTNVVQATNSQIIIAKDPELVSFIPGLPFLIHPAYVKISLNPSLYTINAIPKKNLPWQARK